MSAQALCRLPLGRAATCRTSGDGTNAVRGTTYALRTVQTRCAITDRRPRSRVPGGAARRCRTAQPSCARGARASARESGGTYFSRALARICFPVQRTCATSVWNMSVKSTGRVAARRNRPRRGSAMWRIQSSTSTVAMLNGRLPTSASRSSGVPWAAATRRDGRDTARRGPAESTCERTDAHHQVCPGGGDANLGRLESAPPRHPHRP